MAITVAIPDATGVVGPAAGITVMALPYDRDSLLTSMENEAALPRPHTVELDSLFQLFREPFSQSTKFAVLVNRLRDSLRVTGTDPAGTAKRVALEDSILVLERARVKASERLDEVRTQVSPRIDSLRAEVRL